MEDDDDFYDTQSLTSHASINNRRRNSDRSFLSLSRNTIYHSAVDLEMEMENLTEPSLTNHQNKVSKTNKTITYSQWKHRSWRRFSKGDYCIDFVLAHSEHNYAPHREKREFFENSLKDVGFIMEKEAHQKVNFVKIHAPKEVLIQYAEILKMRLPIKQDSSPTRENRNFVDSLLRKALNYCRIQLDTQKFPPKKNVLTAIFSKDKNYLFDVDAENFICTSARTEIVSYILHREKFSPDDQDQGIRKLLSEGVYKAAYPLHDGDISTGNSQRKLLYDEWAKLSNCFKLQPIDNIKEYFGVKIGLYFTWLGFYTHMLIPASVVGLICFIYGLSTLGRDTLVKEICNSTAVMCPLCDKNCDYWKLSDTCTYSKVVHVVDNSATIFFAVFMSFWAALYLELWKRSSAGVTHKWGLTGFGAQCEPPRPEYLARLVKIKKNKRDAITGKMEPHVPFWRVKLPSIFLSFSVALFWVLLAVAVVFGIVIYRMALLTSDKLYGNSMSSFEYVLPITAAILNLIAIFILNYIYNFLAEKLTELEMRRTQTEFDDSLTLKIYMFQFVNYYSCIFYIAFLKGKFVGYPLKYNRVFGYRQEECNPGGCLVELTIQLCTIMIGKQALNSFMEMFLPFLYKMYNSFKQRTGFNKTHSEETIIGCNQWTEDYKLTDLEPQGLFHEYLEMVIQYGFITIFVTAFPLAPLFALLNNVFELRLDAQKLIKYYRRPVPQRVRDIGVWLPIMDFIGRIAVISNAFIIAFSSHFIPQLVYYLQNDRKDLYGYLNFTLAHFNVKDFSPQTEPETTIFNDLTTCYYMEYRHPPSHEFRYKKSTIYWNILAARLAFVVVYQNLVGFLISVVQWAVPDVPKKLSRLIAKENYETNEIIIKHETERAKLKLQHGPTSNLNHTESNGVHLEEANGTQKRNSIRNSLYHDIIEDT